MKKTSTLLKAFTALFFTLSICATATAQELDSRSAANLVKQKHETANYNQYDFIAGINRFTVQLSIFNGGGAAVKNQAHRAPATQS